MVLLYWWRGSERIVNVMPPLYKRVLVEKSINETPRANGVRLGDVHW